MQHVAGMAREAGYGQPGIDLRNLVVVGKIGSESGLCEIGNLIGADLGIAHRTQGFAVRETERGMTLRSWLFGKSNGKYEQAIDLADELTKKMRERSNQHDPFKAVLADLFFHTHDPTLVADAYEISQEARIYKGPDN